MLECTDERSVLRHFGTGSEVSRIWFGTEVSGNAMALHCMCIVVQLWDIRDGACKQTFTGHESDINTISASYTTFYLLQWLVRVRRGARG